MKEEKTQKFIVKFDYEYLSEIIGKKYDFPVLNENYYCINDEILLGKFRWFGTSENGVNLIGSILDNVDKCLSLIYFDENGNGWKFEIFYDLNEVSVDYTTISEELFDDAKNIQRMADIDKNSIFVEVENKVRYYKEYFLRLYDIGINSSK